MGGEKCSPGWIFQRERGSPPHGRGKEPVNPYGGMGTGITPAWAGKSFSKLFHDVEA